MKTSEFNQLVENIIMGEVKKTIMESVGKKETFHIMCNGEPVDSFTTEDEANNNLETYKKNHPDKEFIIEKSVYESHEDMIDKLDEMGEKLGEEKLNENMEKKSIKVKSLAEAILHAKENNIKKIKVGEKSYDVTETWKSLYEGEGAPCPKCGEVVCECDEVKEDKFDLGRALDSFKKDDGSEEECNECGDGKYDLPEGFDEYVKKMGSDAKTSEKDRIIKEPETVSESKNKKVKLKESEFISLITKMVNEAINTGTGGAGVPGITVTKKAQNDSKKENDEYSREVEKKMKDYLSFDGNDNPEFPHQVGGDKMAVQNDEKQDEVVADNRGNGVEDVKFDVEPNDTFKNRAKEALEGSSKMGNPKDAANTIETETGKKINKKISRKKEKENKEFKVSWGHSWKEPEKVNVVNEEIEKFKKLINYK